MSNSDRFTIRAAVYLILIKDEKVLLLRRFNTPWRNGEYTLPAGHVDGGEPMQVALCREAKEEVGIIVKSADLKFAHVMHQYENYEYVDLYFVASTWEGEPTNCEPEKCDELRWAPLHDLPTNVIPNVKHALTSFANTNYYSEFGW